MWSVKVNVFNAYAKLCGSLWAFLMPTWAFAVEQSTQAQAVNKVVEPMSALGKVVLMLVVVIGIILLLAWLLNKTRAVNMLGQSGVIKTLAIMPLGVKEKVALIQVGEKQLILGITPQQITCLAELDTPLCAQQLSQESHNSFAELLKRAIKK